MDAAGSCEDETPIEHGTTVAHIVLRYARATRLLVAKAGDGQRPYSDKVIEAITWAVDSGANIINLSSGFPFNGCTDGTCPVCTTIADVSAMGIIVVVAAGNKPPGLPEGDPGNLIACPALARGALCVGAVGPDGGVPDYSTLGRPGVAKPDLLAPGMVTFRSGKAPLEGTSFAAPVVSAALAVLGPTLGYSGAVALLQESARPMSHSPYPTGHGMIDLENALEVARHA